MRRNEQTVAFDVLVLGEALVELASPKPLRDADVMRVSCSGDAMNAAAAAAAAGASVGLVTAVGDDELGERILAFAADRGIDTRWVRRRPEPNGIYFASGEAEFVYVRRDSAASKVGPGDLEGVPFRETSALVVSGITQALSASCGAAVEAAAGAVAAAGGHVVYDPNFRRRLTTVEDARAALRRLAPLAGLITPSCPDDTVPLLGTDDPAEAAVACRALGAGAVAVTLGRRGLLVEMGEGPVRLPPLPAPAMIDPTGAGDVLAGTTAARLALGDSLLEALRTGMAAAALSLAGAGGTGRVPTLDQSRALLHRHADAGARPARPGTALRRGA